MNADKIKKR